jgi:uncharacterized protein GlcG (DUF336 family)
MKKPLIASVALAALCLCVGWSPAGAQVTFTTPSNDAARAPRPSRDRGPALEPSLVAAKTAVEACANRGYQVTAVVVDSAGLPVVLLSGNGAAAITQSIAMGKAVSSVRNGKPSAELAIEAQKNPELAARLQADSQQGPQRGGGIPIMSGSTAIGAIAVSGSPDGGWDAECAQAGLDKAMSAPAAPRSRR